MLLAALLFHVLREKEGDAVKIKEVLAKRNGCMCETIRQYTYFLATFQ